MLTATAPPPRATVGSWIGSGVTMIRDEPGRWALLTFLTLAPLLVPLVATSVLYVSAMAAAMPLLQDPTVRLPPDSPLFSLAGQLPLLAVTLVVAALVSSWLSVGMWRAAVLQLDGQRPSRQAFEGNLALVPGVLLTGLAVSVVVTAGILMCVLPGLVAAAALQFAIPLTIERGLGPLEAMAESWRVTRGDLPGYTLHALTVSVLSSLGSYLCGVGMLLTYPLYFTATAAAFRDLFPRELVSPRGFEPRLPP